MRAFCHPALSADVAALHTRAVCSVNNVIAYYLSQEFGPALREIICRISIPDGFSLGSTRWMVISKTKDCSGLLVVWPTRRIRTGYWNVQNHTPSDICPCRTRTPAPVVAVRFIFSFLIVSRMLDACNAFTYPAKPSSEKRGDREEICER